MKNRFSRILTAILLCAVISLPVGCGGDNAVPLSSSDVSSSDVSASDVTSTDISGSDLSVPSASSSDVSSSDTDWYSALSGDEKLIADVVLASADAVNRRDVEAYMSTVDPESKAYDSTMEDAVDVFSHYRLTVTVDSIEVTELKGDKAKVTVTQITLPAEAAPVSGSDVSSSDVLSGTDLTAEFTPCVTVLTHTVVRRDGVWYINSTTVESYSEISTQWDIFASATAADSSAFQISGSATSPQPVSDADANSAAADAATNEQ